MFTHSNLDNLTLGDLAELSRRYPALIGSPAALAVGSIADTALSPLTQVEIPERPVLVTTEHRGVFFGYGRDLSGDTVFLSRARNCIYWPASQKGFLGLASEGPGDGARVGPAADIELRGITSISTVTPEAVKRWEAAPWES